MNEINVHVFRFDSKAEKKEIYRNVIVLPTGLKFPFDDMVSSLAFLYPKSLIQFSLNV